MKNLSVEQRDGFEPKRLLSRQKEILRWVSSGLYNHKEIAEILGVTTATVCNIIRSELGRKTLAMFEDSADFDVVQMQERIKTAASLALTIQEDMMLDEETPLRLKKDLTDGFLNRAGFSPVNKNMNLNVSAGLTREDIERIKTRARELEESVRENINEKLNQL
jgi:predicted transcriptional regulator